MYLIKVSENFQFGLNLCINCKKLGFGRVSVLLIPIIVENFKIQNFLLTLNMNGSKICVINPINIDR